MPVQLNHTIVHARDSKASARFVAALFDRPEPVRYGPFEVVELDNGVSLDFMDDAGEIPAQHYAFLVSEPEFDEIFGRIKERGLDYYADPYGNQKGEINHGDGGRGFY